MEKSHHHIENKSQEHSMAIIDEKEIFNNNSIYFISNLNDEDFPYYPSLEVEKVCKNLDGVFHSIFNSDSKNMAKSLSKEEREKKNMKGLSFVYSEIVMFIYYYRRSKASLTYLSMQKALWEMT